jgi:hypothetical protein
MLYCSNEGYIDSYYCNVMVLHFDLPLPLLQLLYKKEVN